MLLFVSFLPKMCPQLLKARCLACSRLPIPRFRPCGRVDAAAVWFSTLVKSKYIAPRTLLLLRRVATEGPNSNPVICSGLGRRCSAGIMSFWMTLGRIVCTRQFLHLWVIVCNDFQIRAWFCTPVVALPPNEELLPEVRVIRSMRRTVMPDHAPLKTPARSFHEKAGECQVFSFILSLFSFFFFVSSFAYCSHSAKPPLSPPFHPHSLLSDCRPVQVGCS